MPPVTRLHLLCNAHLDPYWQWEWEEGAAAAVSTFRSAADCCEQSKEGLVFCHNEALLYQWIEEYEPALFTRIQRLVKEGRWHIMGGWHLQPDCNLPCIEAFVRQIQLGRRWFKEKFNAAPTTAINFDSFGHTRGMVQILTKAGYDSYIHCRPDNNLLPLAGNTYVWVGYDGSELMVQRTVGWYSTPLGQAAVKIHESATEQMGRGEALGLRLWGVGNHGGGPSKIDTADLDAYISGKEINGVTRPKEATVVHSTPEKYFSEVKKVRNKLPRVERDINSCMVGCYTSMIRIKQKNRLLENELWATEKMLAAAAAQGRVSWPQDDLDAVMRDLATAQFHDILPGSSIQPVEDAGIRLFDHGLEILSRLKARAFFALASGQSKPTEGEIPVLIYNPHPWPVSGIFECEFMLADINAADNEFTLAEVWQDGKKLPSQIEKEHSTISLDWRKRVAFQATLAPSSMNRFDCRLHKVEKRPTPTMKPERGAFRFDNGRLSVTINTLTGLIDRLAVDGVNVVEPGAGRLLVIRDDEDPWGMNVKSFREVEGSFALLPATEGSRVSGLRAGNIIDSVRVVEEGPARTVIEAVFGFGTSQAIVTYKLPKVGTEIEVQARVIWAEKDKMLKFSLPTPYSKGQVVRQVTGGEESFVADGRETVIGQWVCAGHEKGAVGISNDGIYGADWQDSELRLSLLRSAVYCGHPINDRPIAPQDRFVPRIDQGERIFTFRIDAESAKAGSQKKHAFDTLHARMEAGASLLNQKPMALSFFPSGAGKPVAEGVSLSDPQVQLLAFKAAIKGKGWIVRLYNASAQKRSVTLNLPAAGVKKIAVKLGTYEIKTLRVGAGGKVTEAELLD